MLSKFGNLLLRENLAYLHQHTYIVQTLGEGGEVPRKPDGGGGGECHVWHDHRHF